MDRYGGKVVMAWGVALWSLATFLTPWAAESSLLALLVMRMLLGIAEGVALPCMNNMIARYLTIKLPLDCLITYPSFNFSFEVWKPKTEICYWTLFLDGFPKLKGQGLWDLLWLDFSLEVLLGLHFHQFSCHRQAFMVHL